MSVLPRALLLLALLAGCRGEEASPFTAERLARMELRARVAQMVAPALGPDARGDSALAAAGVGGVWVADLPAASARRRLDALQRAAFLPLLAVAPFDRGPGTALAGAAELPLASALGEASHAPLARAAAGGAREAGLHLALLELPDPADPFAGTPEAFAAYLRALADAGVHVGVRAAPPLAGDGAVARTLFVDPLAAAVEAGARAVSLPHAPLWALTRDSLPLAASPVAVAGMLRRDLGFAGLVVAELPPGSPLVRAHGGEGAAAVRAVAAGADLVVGVSEWRPVVDSLVAAVEAGRISPGRVEASVARVFAAKEALGLRRPVPAAPVVDTTGPPRPAAPPADRVEEHRAALVVAGRPPAEVLRGCRRVVLVTRPGAGAATLSAALAERIPGLLHLETGAVARRGPLVVPEVPFAGAGADCVVAASFPHAPLAAVPRSVPRDTAAGAADTVPRRIVWLAFLPGRDTLPAVPALVVARGTGAAAQLAAASVVTGTGEVPAPHPGVAWPPARTLRLLPPEAAGMRGDSLAAIDRLMRDSLRAGVFSAAAVAVGRRGVLVKLTGYGSVRGAPVDPAATLFDIASLTKVVGTTSAAMALVEDGTLELDAPVRRWVDDFRGGDRGRITVRDLLTHTSGLPPGAWLYGAARGPDHALERVRRAHLPAEPGARVAYSDFGMILLAAAVEAAAEEPIDRLLARRVFAPLGMASTGYLPPVEAGLAAVPTAARSERAYPLRGVVHDGNAFRLGGVAGHAGLFSTATDLSVFAQTLLNGGAYGPRRVFRPATVAAFTRRQPGAGTRALGWDTPAPLTSAGSYLSAGSFGHTGYTGTSMWIDPERELFVILLTNRTYTEGSQDALLNLRARVADYAALSIADQEVRPRPGSVAARRLEAARRPPPRRPAPRRRN